jgi:hypothetical protein
VELERLSTFACFFKSIDSKLTLGKIRLINNYCVYQLLLPPGRNQRNRRDTAGCRLCHPVTAASTCSINIPALRKKDLLGERWGS